MSVTADFCSTLKSPENPSWQASIAVCALVFVALVDAGFVAALAPQIAADFNVDKTLVAGSVAVYAVAAASVALVLGAYGRMRAYRWLPLASALFVVAALLAAVAPQLTVFYLARALAGFAGGLISALAIAALADASSYAQRGRQMSLVAVAYFLAPVLGIPAAALITQNYNWQLVFVVVAALSTIVGFLVWQFPLNAVNDRADTVNLKSAPADIQPSIIDGFGSIKIAFSTRSRAMGVVGAFFVSGGLVGFTSFVGIWLSEAFGRQPSEVAVVYAAAGAAAVGGGALGGLLADRYGKRRIALNSSLWLAVMLVVVPTFSWSLTLVALMGLTAFVAALRIAPLQALITELVGSRERTAYIAWRNASSQLGIAAAVWLSALMYTRSGLFGVAVVCAGLTVFAWLCTRLISEPQISAALTKNDGGSVTSESDAKFGTSIAVAASTNVSGLSSVRPKSVVRRALQYTLTLIVAVSLVVPFLLSLAVTKAGTRSGERNRTDTPSNYGAEFENHFFVSSDGNRLSGWYLPGQAKNTTIVMTHGLFRSRYELLERAVEFSRLGYAVLLYDVRRHGMSGGEFSTIGYNERLDVIAAVDFARARAPAHRIVLLGVSMGAAATLLAASELGNRAAVVTAVVAESSFLSFRHTITHHVELAGVPTFPFAAMLVNLTAWRMNFAPDDFDIRRAVERITVPILFIGGGRDTRMPTESVLEPLYSAARHPLKQKLVVPEAKHGQAYHTAPVQYVRAVEEFLAQATAAVAAATKSK